MELPDPLEGVVGLSFNYGDHGFRAKKSDRGWDLSWGEGKVFAHDAIMYPAGTVVDLPSLGAVAAAVLILAPYMDRVAEARRVFQDASRALSEDAIGQVFALQIGAPS